MNPENKDAFLIRYGELGLKDNNRAHFEKKLEQNLREALDEFNHESVERLQGGLVVHLNKNSPLKDIKNRLKSIPGIVWFASGWTTDRNPNSISNLIMDNSQSYRKDATSFAISTQRSDKSLNLTSPEFSKIVGGEIDEKTDLTVDLDDPDWDIHVHVMYDRSFIFFERDNGMGGLPVGSSGSMLSLLSGGIDSPVAAIRMFKRGVKLDFLHFYPYPDTVESLERKLQELVETLSRFGTTGKLYLAPYHIFDLSSPSFNSRDEILLFRRHMMRIGSHIAGDRDHTGIVTGESLGQVASQTIENIRTIESVSDFPIIRPLIDNDKQEIIDLSQKYGTFQLSTDDYQDCCSIQSSRIRTKTEPERYFKLENQKNFDRVDERVLREIDVYNYDQDSLTYDGEFISDDEDIH